MASFKKILTRLLTFGLIAILAIYLGLFIYLKFGWKNHYSKHEVENLIKSVRDTPSLPDSFYAVYDKLFLNRHEKITTRYLISFWPEFFLIDYKKEHNWQLNTARLLPYKRTHYKLGPLALAFKLNKEAPPEKCFDYMMTKRYSEYVSHHKINEPISSLQKTENAIRFIIASERPHYFKVHPSAYKQETDSLKAVLFLR